MVEAVKRKRFIRQRRGYVSKMTMKEASERYQIPIKILKEYEKWELCGAVKKVMGAWQYDDQDIERLSMIMTLHDMGFNTSEVETYMRLSLEGDHTEPERNDTGSDENEKNDIGNYGWYIGVFTGRMRQE